MTDDLSRKPCPCGKEIVEIISFSEPDMHRPRIYPYRKGWFCFACRHWEDAIFRERTVDILRWLKKR